MTTSQPAHRIVAGSLRRVLDRSFRALRNLYNDEVYAWGRFFRAGLPPEGSPEAAGKARGGRTAGSPSPVPAGSASGDRAA